ncbi:hypothetical protein DB346_24405 [Verrucomicrobia bacterium LW23]|nr:hypothetical protein DB346_24405 [Verrucomicrobia bacterium LW23]
MFYLIVSIVTLAAGAILWQLYRDATRNHRLHPTPFVPTYSPPTYVPRYEFDVADVRRACESKNRRRPCRGGDDDAGPAAASTFPFPGTPPITFAVPHVSPDAPQVVTLSLADLPVHTHGASRYASEPAHALGACSGSSAGASAGSGGGAMEGTAVALTSAPEPDFLACSTAYDGSTASCESCQ